MLVELVCLLIVGAQATPEGAYSSAASLFEQGKDAEALQVALTGRELLRSNPESRLKTTNVVTAVVSAEKLGQMLDTLITDLQRRRANPLAAFAPGRLKELKGAARTQYLIAQLENVTANSIRFNGYVTYGDDPVVRAVVSEGPVILDALFQVADLDRRLVRAVQQSRFPYGLPSLGTVAGPARTAIQGIMQVSWRGDLEHMRTFWDATRSMSPPERWLYVLQEDHAGQQAWIESATRLTDAAHKTYSGALGEGRKLATPADARMKGEVIRAECGDQISEIISRRVTQLIVAGSLEDGGSDFKFAAAAELAICRAKWDSEGAVPVLSKVYAAAIHPERDLTHPYGGLGTHLSRSIDWRLRLGDQSAVKDFRAMLAVADWSDAHNLLMPLWRHRDVPEVRKLASDLFLGPDSAFNIAKGYKDQRGFTTARLDSKLWLLSSFRASVVKALQDQTYLGSQVRKGHQIESTRLGYWADVNDPLLPREGESVPLRVCDLVMHDLALSNAFRTYWPNAEKDRAIAEVASLIEREGEGLAKRFHFIDPDPWIR